MMFDDVRFVKRICLRELLDEPQQLLGHHFSSLLGVVRWGANPDHRIDVGAEGLVRELRGEVVCHQLAVYAFGPIGGESGYDCLGVEIDDGEREP